MDLREKYLLELENISQENINIANIYWHIFSCMEYELLTKRLEFLKEDIVKNKWWFVDFHKSMRQIDFFNNVFIHYNVDEQTFEDIEEIEKIKNSSFI